MNSKNHNYFCSSYINKYLECVKMNIPIFGNEHGIDMCSHINLILEFYTFTFYFYFYFIKNLSLVYE